MCSFVPILRSFRYGMLLVVLLCPELARGEPTVPDLPSSWAQSFTQRDGRRVRKRKSPAGKRQNNRSSRGLSTRKQPMRFGVGLNVGSEAVFGNGVVGQFLPTDWLDLEVGIGLNSSGLKLGAGSSLLLEFTREFRGMLGFALAYSGGRASEVVLSDVQFTPEGSRTPEALAASKEYEVSSAVMGSLRIGGYYYIMKNILLRGIINYNLIMSGNTVTFKDGLEYDKSVAITNEAQFDEEFRRRAEEEVKAGGLGLSLGVSYLL